jgi:hypothetical protein
MLFFVDYSHIRKITEINLYLQIPPGFCVLIKDINGLWLGKKSEE